MPIDLRLLRHAQALAEHGSFSRAAEALNIAQPSLSRGIQTLEARIGMPLFNRSRAGHEPTDFGRVFLQHAADVLAEADDLEREVALAKGLGTGELSVGLGPYVAEVLGPECAGRFAASHAGVRLRTAMSDPGVLARALRTRVVDLAIAERSLLDEDDALETVAALTPLQGYVIVRAGHPLRGSPRFDFADVLDYPFAQVVMLPPRVLRPILAARRPPSAGKGARSAPFPAIECPTPRFAAKIVTASDAFTFASLGMVQAELERGEVVPLLQAPWMRVEWSIVRLRKRTMSPAMIAFCNDAQRVHEEALKQEEALRRKWAGQSAPLPPPDSPRHSASTSAPGPRAARARAQR